MANKLENLPTRANNQRLFALKSAIRQPKKYLSETLIMVIAGREAQSGGAATPAASVISPHFRCHDASIQLEEDFNRHAGGTDSGADGVVIVTGTIFRWREECHRLSSA